MHTPPGRLLPLAILAAACTACATPPPAEPVPEPATMAESAAEWRAAELPDMDSVLGPLAIRVVYPVAGSVVDATDSSFMFGSTGHGAAALTINGAPVPVAPNGAWLAWVALPPDSMMRFELVARTSTDTARSVLEVRRAVRAGVPLA